MVRCSSGRGRLSFFLVLWLGQVPGLASAAWPTSSLVNVPLCTAMNSQLAPVLATDGSGGAIAAWSDNRAGATSDIYAQHVLANGTVDSSWPTNGVLLCGAAGNQIIRGIVADGTSGAIVVWQDARTGTNDIYAQHVLGQGVVDAAWPVDGASVCSASGSQSSPVAISDGTHGAIIAWLDFRSDTTSNVYVQHLLGSGTVDGAWPVDGRALCTAVGNQQRLTMTSDAQGGAIVAWQDFRGGATADIYSGHVLASGSVDPAWPADGVVVCSATGNQMVPDVAIDGHHGAIVTWYDFRGGATSDIYGQHVRSDGSVDPAWPNDGRALCLAVANQQLPKSVSDGAGGAVVAWVDSRNASTGSDVYATHVKADGSLDPAWPVDGTALCTAFGGQVNHSIAGDGTGGAIVSWEDSRTGVASDIYAQHVQASGAVDPAWPANGRGICTASTNQQLPAILADGSGGAILAWADFRATGGAFSDIYAQRVQADGQLGGSVVGVPVTQPTVDALGPVSPNPSNGLDLTLSLTLPRSGPVSIELLDVRGRRLALQRVDSPSATVTLATLGYAGQLPPGIYLLSVRQGATAWVRRFAVVN